MIRNLLITGFFLGFALVAQAGALSAAQQGWGGTCSAGPILLEEKEKKKEGGEGEGEGEGEKKKGGEEEEPDCE